MLDLSVHYSVLPALVAIRACDHSFLSISTKAHRCRHIGVSVELIGPWMDADAGVFPHVSTWVNIAARSGSSLWHLA